MSKSLEAIHASLRRFEESPKGFGIHWRQWLSALILDELAARGWDQKDLAKVSGLSEPFISRLVHSGSNFEAEVFGRVLHAFNIHPTQIVVSKQIATEEPVVVQRREVPSGQETDTEYGVIARISADGSSGTRVELRSKDGPSYRDVRQFGNCQAL
jgi:transcriptional regulator with XRE-family HTH domain